MTLSRLVLTAALAAAAPALPARAAPLRPETPAQARQEIARLYQISDRAADAQDAATPASLASADYVFVGLQGDRHPRLQALSSLQINYTQMHTFGFHTRTTTHINSIRVAGDRADVLYSQHQTLRHGLRSLALDVTGADQWVCTAGEWKLAQTRVLASHQDKPITSLLSPPEVAALNTLTALRNQAAMQDLSNSVALFNRTLAIDQSINDGSSQQIREEEQRRRHKELYGY